MARRRRSRRHGGFRLWWLGAGLGALVLLAVALAAAAYLWLRTSLPVVDGTVEVAGLNAPVEVVRDKNAIPHIFATTDHDAFFALGFVHAQDRLWQMEFQRRIAAGRLSEVLGERTLTIDKFIRTMGIPQAAAATAARLSPETRAVYEAYAEGVNASIADDDGAPPLEFVLLGHKPEPWRVEDSISWAKMMAWDLGGNAWDEALRARLAKTLTADELAVLWPNHPVDRPATPADETVDGVDGFAVLARAFPRRPPDGQGSNNWVLSGNHTASGKPMLANDPHLSLTTPSLWYLAHLSAPGLNVIGATLPGIPAPVLGRNQRIAWGFTNTNPDVQDLFIETIDPSEPKKYLTPSGPAPFVERTEIIHVKDKPDITLIARETRHGPVVSDLVEHSATFLPEGRIIAFAWTALSPDDLTAQAGLNVLKAADWDGFVAALKDFAVPEQNMVYADIEGNIGYIAPGHVPIRSSGEGWVPSDGASGAGDWIGTIPFYRLPRAFNPPSGRIVTANNRIVGPDYPYFLTHDWSSSFRADRINMLLDARETHDVKSFAAIQQDVTSLGAQRILPLLLGVVKTEDAAVKAALERLKSFDGVMAAYKSEPLIYVAWLRELMRGLFADELQDGFLDYWSNRLAPIEVVLTSHQGFCDDRTTAAKEDCGFILGAALERALADLRRRYGEDMAAWRWGEAHAVHARHRVLGEVPGLGGLFEINLPHGGERDTVNAGGFTVTDELDPFGQNHGASYRAIYDLANPDRSVFIQSSGQSGNPFSPFYKSFAPLWQTGGYVPMVTDRATIEADKLGTLTLTSR
ncbi:MAG: penicillin acylase family protein [Alphaproteobacteria bacterium]|nr:penicillin acylase family protein [Alphaproteobacteria bacterium]